MCLAMCVMTVRGKPQKNYRTCLANVSWSLPVLVTGPRASQWQREAQGVPQEGGDLRPNDQ